MMWRQLSFSYPAAVFYALIKNIMPPPYTQVFFNIFFQQAELQGVKTRNGKGRLSRPRSITHL
jgi:hypothetical protein